jgi:hypothetical protein
LAVASSLLEDIAAQGVAARPLQSVVELIAGLMECCREKHDDACCAFGGVLSRIEDWRSKHEDAGGVPRAALSEIDEAVRAAAGSVVAGDAVDVWSELLSRADLLLVGPSTWIKRDQATPLDLD